MPTKKPRIAPGSVPSTSGRLPAVVPEDTGSRHNDDVFEVNRAVDNRHGPMEDGNTGKRGKIVTQSPLHIDATRPGECHYFKKIAGLEAYVAVGRETAGDRTVETASRLSIAAGGQIEEGGK